MSAEPTVEQIVAAICKVIEAGDAALADGVTRYIEAGGMLRELKTRLKADGIVKHGAWLGWVDDHFPFGHRTAQRLMRLHRHHAELKATRVTLSLNEALRRIAGPARRQKKRKPRPRGDHPRPPQQPEAFGAPDPAYQIRHMLERGGVAAYQPDEPRIAMLEVDLPELMDQLHELAETHDIETGLRRYEPPEPPTLDGEGHRVSDAVLLEAPPPPAIDGILVRTWLAAMSLEEVVALLLDVFAPDQIAELLQLLLTREQRLQQAKSPHPRH